ncbi:hypothetical protein GCM10028808_73900 [Spirosoma migulaei]
MLALLATFYQLYLQRLHNEKSLKPLGQIVLEDRQQVIAVHLRNNGLGPLIIDRITCRKNGVDYTSIEACINLEQKSYLFAPTNDSVTRIVLPNSSLTIFETRFDDHEDEAAIDHARKQLTPISLKVESHDIYDNKTTIERDFQWFSRYMLEENIER